jgi:hypothetical protein
MSTVQNLLESAAGGWKNLQNDAARLANKWAKTGLLEGLEETDKNNMSLMLENQAKQLVVESSATGGTGAFTAGTGEQWAGIALPLVRKVFGQIAAKEFVSVQPMNFPSGLVFYLDFQYGNAKNPFNVNNSMYGNTGSQYPFANPSPVGGLYGAGRFTYSTNQTSSLIASGVTIATGSWAEVNYDSDLSASAVAGEVKKFSFSSSLIPSYDVEAVRGFIFTSGSTQTVSNLLPAFTTTTANNTVVNFFFSSSTAQTNGTAAAVNCTVIYTKATALGGTPGYNVGDFEDGSSFAVPNSASTSTIVIPEVNVKMRSEAIVAKTKKLKAVWTPEFAQDLNAYQALDAEAELTSIMSEYISLEIDLEILDMLIADVPATNVEYWSAINNTTLTATSLPTANLGFYNTQGQWFQTLGTKLQKLSNKIHQLTLRGGANFLVCSPTVSTIIESIPGFASNSDGTASKMQYAFGVQKAGNLNSKYNVYKNPYMTENTILVGFRGTQFLEAGAVFAPYIPLIMTPLVYDPDTFTPRKGLMTRFAKKMLRPEFYGKIYVNGLNTL